MIHRGPDEDGLWQSSDLKVALGHTRLSIIGLEDGRQPITNETGDIVAVVNGELYDFERIRAELEAKGHRFRTHTDSEILVHLYEEYGVDCLQYLRGEFAFVLWDERAGRIFAARDRFGIKPIYFSQKGTRLFIASEAKSLFAAGVTPEWDLESYFQAANMQYVLPHRTLFEGVQQLQPGHYLLAQQSLVATFQYWDLQYSKDEDCISIGEKEAIDEFGRILSESVRLRLRADIDVCCHLSGGLDSSAVAALSMKHRSRPIKCFSVSFEEESYDEAELAREMSELCGADFYPVRVKHSDMLESLSDAVYFSEGLAVNGHLTAKFLLNRAIADAGFKVALTGEGADEVVAGYPHLRSDLFRSQGREHLLGDLHASNKASQGIMLMHGQMLSLEAVQARLGYTPSFLEAKASLGYKMCGLLKAEFSTPFAGYDAYARFLDCFNFDAELKHRNPVNQSLYLWTKCALPNYILRTLGDGMEMASSVEGRLPFLDHKLFEFVRTLPVSLKIKDTREKYILREAVRPMVTEKILSRQKHPFVAPPASRFSGNLARTILTDTIGSKCFESIPFFDVKKVSKVVDALPGMKEEEQAAMDPVLMMVLSTAAMHERFGL